MVLGSVRERLDRQDASLVVQLVARGSAADLASAEAALAEGGIDSLLDDPRLREGLLGARQGMHASFPLFAYVVVRQALRDAGEEDRRVADYVARILLHFGLRQRARQIAGHDDATFDTLAGLLEEGGGRDERRAFLAMVHLGNYALWLSGLFPDHIEQRRWRRGGPDLAYFETMGQQGFRVAGEHRLASAHGVTPVFEAAAERFPCWRRALNSVRDHILFPHVHTPERLMRQVRDRAHWIAR